MQNRKLLATALVILAFVAVAALVSLSSGSHSARAGVPNPTATPCPKKLVPDPGGDGCIKVTITMTPTPIPCPTDMVYDPYMHACVPITPTRTPCPPGKVFDSYHGSGCGTPTATPTSNRPYGAQVTLLDHYPSPPVSGHKVTWIFEIENVGSGFGCEVHEVTLSAQLTGVSDAGYISSATLGCHETTEVNVSSIVTVPLNAKVSVSAHVSAGAQQGNTVEFSETAVNEPPPTAPPTPLHQLGDFNCDGLINSIDAAIILQLSAGMRPLLAYTCDGDVNHDGELSSIDAALILQYTAGLITTFP